jgi:hypothetical protein
MIYFSVVFIRHIPAKNIITNLGEKSTGSHETGASGRDHDIKKGILNT